MAMSEWFYLVSELNDMVLSLSHEKKGSKLVISQQQNLDKNLWAFSDDGKIINKTGLVADVNGENKAEGVHVIGWSNKESGVKNPWNQKWRYENGLLVSQLNGMVMDVEGGKPVEGQSVIMWPKHEKPWQKWRIKYEKEYDSNIQNTDWYFIENHQTGLVLDTNHKDLGGKAQAKTKSGTNSQMWRIDDGMLINKDGFVVDQQEKSLGITTIKNKSYTWSYKNNMIKTASGSALHLECDSADGYVVSASEAPASRCESWSMVKVDCDEMAQYVGKWFAIQNESMDLVLSVTKNESSEPNVTLKEFIGGDDDTWFFTENHHFVNKCGLVLDVKREKWAKNTEIIGFPPKNDNSTNQLWKYEYGLIISCYNGLAVTVKGPENNRKIVTWPREGSLAQKWRLNESLIEGINMNQKDDNSNEESELEETDEEFEVLSSDEDFVLI